MNINIQEIILIIDKVNETLFSVHMLSIQLSIYNKKKRKIDHDRVNKFKSLLYKLLNQQSQ